MSRASRTAKVAAEVQAAAPVAAESPAIVATPAIESESNSVATMVATTAATPAQKKGKSTIQYPVAYVWIMCINAFKAAKQNGTPAPSRKYLVAKAIEDGVAYYTSRTQVQAYLKASLGGTVQPKSLPRGVVLSSVNALTDAPAQVEA